MGFVSWPWFVAQQWHTLIDGITQGQTMTCNSAASHHSWQLPHMTAESIHPRMQQRYDSKQEGLLSRTQQRGECGKEHKGTLGSQGVKQRQAPEGPRMTKQRCFKVQPVCSLIRKKKSTNFSCECVLSLTETKWTTQKTFLAHTSRWSKRACTVDRTGGKWQKL